MGLLKFKTRFEYFYYITPSYVRVALHYTVNIVNKQTNKQTTIKQIGRCRCRCALAPSPGLDRGFPAHSQTSIITSALISRCGCVPYLRVNVFLSSRRNHVRLFMYPNPYAHAQISTQNMYVPVLTSTLDGALCMYIKSHAYTLGTTT